uniref:Uncharacterized protein n=1 Tax=Sphaerodactylus townsendi TaxID=933632 RepID=A0ACB8FAV7_9SAUR
MQVAKSFIGIQGKQPLNVEVVCHASDSPMTAIRINILTFLLLFRRSRSFTHHQVVVDVLVASETPRFCIALECSTNESSD